MLQTRAVVFAVEKAGSTVDEWEDGAAADAGGVRYGLRKPRFALADGATEASDSIQGVEQRLESFMGSAERAGPRLDHQSMRRWFEMVQHEWTTTPRRFANIFEERKFAEGSFATFLGCEISLAADGRVTWASPGPRPRSATPSSSTSGIGSWPSSSRRFPPESSGSTRTASTPGRPLFPQ
jgi:hypothetical protein